jgi:hypothetical protein
MLQCSFPAGLNQSVSAVPRIAETLHLLVFTQFRTQNRTTLLLELLYLDEGLLPTIRSPAFLVSYQVQERI